MIAVARPLPIVLLRRLMADRSLDHDDRVAMIAMLMSLDAPDGVIEVTQDELVRLTGMRPHTLRRALGSLWAQGYVQELVRAADGAFQIAMAQEVPE